jgi:hypothetical protein
MSKEKGESFVCSRSRNAEMGSVSGGVCDRSVSADAESNSASTSVRESVPSAKSGFDATAASGHRQTKTAAASSDRIRNYTGGEPRPIYVKLSEFLLGLPPPQKWLGLKASKTLNAALRSLALASYPPLSN